MSHGRYVRFRSPHLDHRGRLPGVFGLVNRLGLDGRLSEADEVFRRRSNAELDAAYTDPMTVDDSVYDRVVNPLAAAWFKIDAATHLVEATTPYLELLDRYGVDWERVTSDDPGLVIYEDELQVVVVPR
jgi:hypothetical protein